MKTTDQILKKILLPDNDDWSIDEVTCDDSNEEIRVRLSYCKPDIVINGVHYSIYDHRPEREWRHLDMWQYKTIITARVPRYQKDGKTISIEVPWALPEARMSWLMEKTIDTLKATKNQTKTASLLRLSFSQVHSVMERAVKRGMSRRDKKYIFKHVCIDEKSVGKGHNYITIVYDGDDGSVIDCTEGRKGEDINTLCASAFTEEQRQGVETVCTDMWDPFINAAKTYFPNAKHCHDMYHCVSYLNDAVDKVRRWEAKQNPVLKNTRYIWLKDQANYTDWQQTKYDQLKACNLRVAEAWAVKEQFRQLIQMPYGGDVDAYLFFDSWFRDALSLKLTAIENVAFMFKRHLKGIIRAWITKANNGKAERMNGSIQEIKTIGRGYATAKRFRTAILFFYGKLDLY